MTSSGIFFVPPPFRRRCDVIESSRLVHASFFGGRLLSRAAFLGEIVWQEANSPSLQRALFSRSESRYIPSSFVYIALPEDDVSYTLRDTVRPCLFITSLPWRHSVSFPYSFSCPCLPVTPRALLRVGSPRASLLPVSNRLASLCLFYDPPVRRQRSRRSRRTRRHHPFPSRPVCAPKAGAGSPHKSTSMLN